MLNSCISILLDTWSVTSRLKYLLFVSDLTIHDNFPQFVPEIFSPFQPSDSDPPFPSHKPLSVGNEALIGGNLGGGGQFRPISRRAWAVGHRSSTID
jgi:hypothetical protein